ncbi:MAG: DUF4440 domain-containing protein [Pyrinomonadaceae bacterium]
MPRSNLATIQARPRITLFVFLVLVFVLAACQTKTAAPDTRAADENALTALDNDWSKAAGLKDVEKIVSYYSNDAVVMPPNSPSLTGKEPVRNFWKGMIGAPGFTGGWKPTKIEVARSGDLAYIGGTYELGANDANGKLMTDKGKYVEVWKKQADGSWKCAIDIFNSDLPVAPSAERKED